MGSTRFTLNSADWKSIFKGLLIAMSAPLIAWLGSLTGLIDLGPIINLVLAGVIATVVNLIRKWVADNTPAV